MAYIDGMVARDYDLDANASTGDLGKTGSGMEQRLYPMQDANWNVTGVVESVSGTPTVRERYVYDPYGTVKVLNADWSNGASSPSFGWNYLHQGGRWDATAGLYNFRNRDYSPILGRWMTQDPLGYVDGGSLYQYVRSQPVVAVDPMGLQGMPSTRPTTRPSQGFDDAGRPVVPGQLITIYVEVVSPPTPVRNQIYEQFRNGAIDINRMNTGHVWLNVPRNGRNSGPRDTAGFYLNGDGIAGDGEVVNERTRANLRQWTHKVPFYVSPETYQILVDRIRRDLENPPKYDAVSFNCNTWVVYVLKQAGIVVPQECLEPYDWTRHPRVISRRPPTTQPGANQ